MPTTARGHGEYGLRSNLRQYVELDSLSSVTRHTYVLKYAAQVVGGPGSWTATGSGAWSIPYNPVFDGKPADPVILSFNGTQLARVETLALCDSTASTWFWDHDAWVPNPGGVDDPDFGADVELGVDDGTELYVHLPGDVDPNTDGYYIIILTIFGAWTGTKNQPALYVMPILGPNMFVDGGLESWASVNQLNDWTNELSAKGVGTLTQDDALIEDGGQYSARLDTDGAPAGSCGIRPLVAVTCQAGKAYRISGAYKTDIANPADVTGVLFMPVSGSNALQSDGRSLSTTGATLDNTRSSVRRFSFDVVWPTGGVQHEFRNLNGGATGAGSVWFDGLSLRRIYGWRFFEARLSSEGLPEFTQSASDVYPGTEEGGGGSLTILNDATEAVPGIIGYLEGMMSRWHFGNNPVVVLHGGQFPDGQDIPWEDLAIGATGLIRSYGCNDEVGRFDLEG